MSDTKPFTRKDYMSDPEPYVPGRTSEKHRRYYRQFVNQTTIATVVRRIGADRLIASTDPSFNDIPLREWDAFSPWLPVAISFRDVGDYPTLSGWVCIAKEAARQYVINSEVTA